MAVARIELSNVDFVVPTFVQFVGTNTNLSRRRSFFTSGSRLFFQILHNISLRVQDGERLGIIGLNGAGKTTLLQMLAGAFQPTSGTIRIVGSRQAMMNLSLGFLPDATVLENCYLRGSAMGISMAAIRRGIEEILDFAELTDKAGFRLSTLSSGERMRLAFAIATSRQPDIMLMDEWLGAGDLSFIQKARERISSRVAGSRIVCLASHNFDIVGKTCTRAVVLSSGSVCFDGGVSDAIRFFRSSASKPAEGFGGSNRIESSEVSGSQEAVASAPVRRVVTPLEGRVSVPFEHRLVFENLVVDPDGWRHRRVLLEISRSELNAAVDMLHSSFRAAGFQLCELNQVEPEQIFTYVDSRGDRVRCCIKTPSKDIGVRGTERKGTIHLSLDIGPPHSAS